jgi:hypothetical protein
MQAPPPFLFAEIVSEFGTTRREKANMAFKGNCPQLAEELIAVSKQFRRLLGDLEFYLVTEVRPLLARIPTDQHKKYHALYCAVQAAAEVERMNISPYKKDRLQHEIAERIAALI